VQGQRDHSSSSAGVEQVEQVEQVDHAWIATLNLVVIDAMMARGHGRSELALTKPESH
jgi:hypothetical protein